MAGWPFKKRSKKRSPATLGFLIRGPRHHRFLDSVVRGFCQIDSATARVHDVASLRHLHSLDSTLFDRWFLQSTTGARRSVQVKEKSNDERRCNQQTLFSQALKGAPPPASLHISSSCYMSESRLLTHKRPVRIGISMSPILPPILLPILPPLK